MALIPPELYARCLAAIDKRITEPCPHCGHSARSIVEELSNIPLARAHVQGVLANFVPAIPVVLVVCKRCGYVAQFSAHVLGVLSDEPAVKPKPRVKMTAKPRVGRR